MPPSAPAAAMISAERPLLLGSASPRRRELLEQMRIPLLVRAPVIDEQERPGETPEDYLHRIVTAKASAVARFQEVRGAAGSLCADTCVTLGHEILGKPKDDADARRMLRRLVGRGHHVLTRYLIQPTDASSPRVERTVRTAVHMRDATDDEIARYVATGEGSDKAGSYAVQGIGGFLVTRIEGSYANVVGLPLSEVISDLCVVGLLAEFP